jgi:hypothetical protein
MSESKKLKSLVYFNGSKVLRKLVIYTILTFPNLYLVGFHCYLSSDDTVIFGCFIDRMRQRRAMICDTIFVVSGHVTNGIYGRMKVQHGDTLF